MSSKHYNPEKRVWRGRSYKNGKRVSELKYSNKGSDTMANILNPKSPKKIDQVETHKNWMGGTSFDINDPIMRLRIAASSCFFGEPQYYSTDPDDKRKARQASMPANFGKPTTLPAAQLTKLRQTLTAIDPQEWRSMTPAQAMVSAIDAALDHDPEATLGIAAALRQADHIRTTPQVILVRAAHHPKVRGTGMLKKYAQEIMARADEPAVGLAYHIFAYGKEKPIPNALKKVWAQRLARASEYDLAKYRLADHSVKTVDVVNLVHAKSPAIGKLMKGELTTEGETWESIISQGGSTKENWEKAIDKMGHMALLRNLRNFNDKGVNPSLYTGKLVGGAATGKQLPFRYYSAYKAVAGSSAPVMDAIEQCLEISLGNLPKFPGRTMALADNSGSARGATTSTMGTMQVSTIANLTAIVAGKVSDDGYIGVFGDTLNVVPVRKRSSVFDQLKAADEAGAAVGGSTENGIWLFWEKAIREKEHWDNVFVMSDMQAGHGGLYGTRASMASYSREYGWPAANSPHIDVAKLVNTYRAKVNPKVNVFLIQVAGYQDTLMPEFYNRTYILGGWGEGVLRFAAAMANIGEVK